MPGEQRMQLRQRIDVLERLVRPRRGVPLVVAFGVDPDRAGHARLPARTFAQRSSVLVRVPERHVPAIGVLVEIGSTSTPFTFTTNSIVDFTWK